jgi:hypothetical protein
MSCIQQKLSPDREKTGKNIESGVRAKSDKDILKKQDNIQFLLINLFTE